MSTNLSRLILNKEGTGFTWESASPAPSWVQGFLECKTHSQVLKCLRECQDTGSEPIEWEHVNHPRYTLHQKDAGPTHACSLRELIDFVYYRTLQQQHPTQTLVAYSPTPLRLPPNLPPNKYCFFLSAEGDRMRTKSPASPLPLKFQIQSEYQTRETILTFLRTLEKTYAVLPHTLFYHQNHSQYPSHPPGGELEGFHRCELSFMLSFLEYLDLKEKMGWTPPPASACVLQ